MTKKILTITSLIVALIVLGATAAYITLRQTPYQEGTGQGGEEVRKEQPVVTLPEGPEEPIVQPEELITPELIDTSDWKTYRNEKYGFEVRYPGEIKLESLEFNGNFYLGFLDPEDKFIYGPRAWFRLTVHEIPAGIATLKDLLSGWNRKYRGQFGELFGLDSISAIEPFQPEKYEEAFEFSNGGYAETYHVAIHGNNLIYLFTYEGATKKEEIGSYLPVLFSFQYFEPMR